MSKVKSNADLLNTPTSTHSPFDSEAFLTRNRTMLMVIGLAIVGTVLAYFAYNYYSKQQEKEAQEQMYPAQYYAEADSSRLTLEGNKNYKGMKKIIDKYPSTKAATLAHFYAGVAYMKDGKYQKAIDELKQFNAGDYLVQARAYCLIGDAYLELKNKEEAANQYAKAAAYQPNEHFTPAYLSKLALVYELLKKNKEAIDTYAKLIQDYPNSSDVANAKKYKARLESMLQK